MLKRRFTKKWWQQHWDRLWEMMFKAASANWNISRPWRRRFWSSLLVFAKEVQSGCSPCDVMYTMELFSVSRKQKHFVTLWPVTWSRGPLWWRRPGDDLFRTWIFDVLLTDPAVFITFHIFYKFILFCSLTPGSWGSGENSSSIHGIDGSMPSEPSGLGSPAPGCDVWGLWTSADRRWVPWSTSVRLEHRKWSLGIHITPQPTRIHGDWTPPPPLGFSTIWIKSISSHFKIHYVNQYLRVLIRPWPEVQWVRKEPVQGLMQWTEKGNV